MLVVKDAGGTDVDRRTFSVFILCAKDVPSFFFDPSDSVRKEYIYTVPAQNVTLNRAKALMDSRGLKLYGRNISSDLCVQLQLVEE